MNHGAIALSDDDRVLVSPHLAGSEAVDLHLRRHAGREVARPTTDGVPPLAHRAWHRRWVFRAGLVALPLVG